MWLFALFLAVPLIEIALFIQIGGAIGLWPTLLIVVLTAILGTTLVRSQGLQAMNSLRSSFSEMRDPSEPLAHGAMILFSGALLLTPGFFTDAVGFALLVPAIRHAVFNYVRQRVKVQTFEYGAGPDPRTAARDDTIEGTYYDLDDVEGGTPGNSGWTNQDRKD